MKSKTSHEQREGIKKLENFLESPESDALRLMDQIARVASHLNQLLGDDDIDDDNNNGNNGNNDNNCNNGNNGNKNGNDNTENTKTTDNK